MTIGRGEGGKLIRDFYFLSFFFRGGHNTGATIYIFGNNTFAAWDISILDMFNMDMVCVREKFG